MREACVFIRNVKFWGWDTDFVSCKESSTPLVLLNKTTLFFFLLSFHSLIMNILCCFLQITLDALALADFLLHLSANFIFP